MAVWAPQIGPQADALSATWCEEMLFGGAKYGGKTDFLLGDYLQDVNKYEKHWQGILFRQSMPEFEEIVRRSHELYPQTGATWLEQKRKWVWPNGATLKFRYMESVKDFYSYNGHSYTWIGFDELGAWPTLEGYLMMIGTLRWAEADIPTKRMRASANPGGPGHNVVNQRFIEWAPGGYVPRYDPVSKMHVMFIPSRIQSNRLGLLRDPNYVSRLHAVGSAKLVKAWLEGDWNAIEGAFFDNFSSIITAPFKIPPHWLKSVSYDHGYARPFSVGWWATANGEWDYDAPCPFRPGELIRYREWYGVASDPRGQVMPNVGVRKDVKLIAEGILERCAREEIAYFTADPSIFADDRGETIYHTFKKHGVNFRRGDNKRIPGWTQMRNRIAGEDGRPMIWVFDTCANSIRTIPVLLHDETNAEDVNTKMEDHAADEWRYECMSWPYEMPVPPKNQVIAPPPVNVRDLVERFNSRSLYD